MPSPRYGFRFEAVYRLRNLNLTLSVYLGNGTFAQIFPFVHKFLTLIVAATLFPTLTRTQSDHGKTITVGRFALFSLD